MRSHFIEGTVPGRCWDAESITDNGSVTVGTPIVLGRHTPWAGDANWDEARQRYVGLTAVVTQLAGVDASGCPGVRVAADGGRFFWRIRDLRM